MSSDVRTLSTTHKDGDALPVGVIGVGSMGSNHARILSQLQGANLIGVNDVDQHRASDVALSNGTHALERSELLRSVDAVSVAVPTAYHYEVVKECIEAGVDVLVEKPFVDDIAKGKELARLARRNDIVLQVGHIERFNPAVQAVIDIVSDLELIAISTTRVGPPLSRVVSDDVVLDLMVHDLDIVLAIADEIPTTIDATGRRDGQYATAQLTFPDELVCTLTASRVTQRRMREMEITCDNCQITVDYLDQSVNIHRHASPEYTQNDGTIAYRNESVIERPLIETEEPLKRELSAFIEASRNDSTPVVTAEDGLRVLEVAIEITREVGIQTEPKVYSQ